LGIDGSFRIDPDEVIRNVETAEVICLHFPLLSKTVVVDTRTDVEDPPLIKILPKAKSVDHRLRSLKRLRPRFAQPRRVTIIPWPNYVSSMVRLGIWDALIQRLTSTGHPDSAADCQRVLLELRTLERGELAAAVTGQQYHTIWQRPQED
jgi:hypothetical protein